MKKKREETDSKLREMEAAKLEKMQALKQEHAYLESQFSRTQSLRQVRPIEAQSWSPLLVLPCLIRAWEVVRVFSARCVPLGAVVDAHAKPRFRALLVA